MNRNNLANTTIILYSGCRPCFLHTTHTRSHAQHRWPITAVLPTARKKYSLVFILVGCLTVTLWKRCINSYFPYFHGNICESFGITWNRPLADETLAFCSCFPQLPLAISIPIYSNWFRLELTTLQSAGSLTVTTSFSQPLFLTLNRRLPIPVFERFHCITI